VRQDLDDALARPEPLIERLKRLTRNFFAGASRRRKLWRFIASSMWMPNTSHPQDLPCAYNDYNKLLSDAIDAAVASGELTPGPTDIRLMVLFGAIGEALDRFLLFEEPALTSALADQLMDVVVSGWLAQPPPSVTPAPSRSSSRSTRSSSSPSSSTSSSSPTSSSRTP
jgi:hypothetical protein